MVPRGGQPARVTNTRQAPPDRFVLISGIAPGPLLFNIGNQSRTFGDLLLLLGQSPEMVSRQQVNATLPHGQWMERDSLLVHNSVIHFHQEAVFADGIREAVDKGFRYESPVKYESTATALPTPIDPSPAKAVPVASPPKLPVIKPQPIYTRPVPVVPTPTPKIGVSSESVNSGIEAAGSTILFDEPMPFPKKTRVELDDEEQSPSVKTNGRTPLMLPKTWPAPEGESLDEKVEDSARILERTSAEYDPEQSHIVTVSAEAAAEERTSSSQPSAPPFEIAGRDTTDSSNSASWFPSPQSWLALIVTVGVAVTSVVVSRRISRDEDSTEADAAPAARADSSVPAPVATRETAHEDEQRFLQRLILNKIPLIEETATLPPVDRLHGLAIGGRRLVVHEAHDGVAGPHFQVRDPNDTRDVELRLRRLLRADRATPKPAPVFVTAAGVQGTRTSRVSPLEKALRTVGRGDAQ